MSTKTTNARLDALEAGLARIEALLLADVDAKTPAKVTPQPKAVRQVKVNGKWVTKAQPKADAKAKRHLTRGNREEFVKAHAWAKGMSTKAIAQELASGRRRATKGWALGEGYKALVKGA